MDEAKADNSNALAMNLLQFCVKLSRWNPLFPEASISNVCCPCALCCLYQTVPPSHYNDVTWASWHLKSPATTLFVQLFIQVYIKEKMKPMMTSSNGNVSMLLAICAGNSVVTGPFVRGFHRRPGVGVTKAPFANFSVSKIFDLAKVPVRFPESHSYLTGVTAAELRRHLPNINEIFNS